MNTEETTVRKAPAHAKPKRRRWGPIVFLVVLIVLLGAVAALVFHPESPLRHAIQDRINPPLQAGAVSLAPEGAERILPETHPVKLEVVLLVPDTWESAPASEAEPAAAERLRALQARAFGLIRDCGLMTTEISFVLTPEALAYETDRPYRYVSGAGDDVAAWAAGKGNSWRYSSHALAVPSPFVPVTVHLEPGIYVASAGEYIIDELGFVWKAEATADAPLHAELTEGTESYEIIYRPVDLAALTEEEYASILAQAGAFADAFSSTRALVLEAAAEPEPAVEPEPEPEPDPEPDDTVSQGSTTPGGSSGGSGGSSASGSGGSSGGSGSGSSGGNSGGTTPGGSSGGGSGSGNGSGPGNGSGSGSGTGGGTHTHTLLTRDVYQGTQEVTVVDSPGHYATVHHDAVYNNWDEHISRCQDCQAILRTNEEASSHMQSTGHHGWYSDVIHHHDLVSEAYDSEEWIPEQSHVVTYAMYVTETYCMVCGEVVATSAPWHY